VELRHVLLVAVWTNGDPWCRCPGSVWLSDVVDTVRRRCCTKHDTHTPVQLRVVAGAWSIGATFAL
jgi:hypothetical protein